MATETDIIEVQFKVAAEPAVTAAYDKISAASVKAENQARKFEAAQEKSTAKAAAAAESSAARQIQANERVASSAAAAAQKSIAASERAERQSTEFASKGSKAFGIATNSLSALGSEFGSVGAAAAQAGTNVSIFSTLLGSAGVGAAVGIGIAAIKLLNDTLEDAFTEHERKADEAIARLNKRNKDAADAAEFKAWSAPSSAIFFPGDQRFEDAKRAHGVKTDKRNRIIDPNAPPAGAGGRGPGAGPEFEAMQRRSETEQRIADLDRADAESRDRVAKGDAMLAGRGFEDPSKAADATRAKLDAEFEAENEHNARLVEMRRDTDAEFQRIDEAAMERERMKRRVASDAVTSVASVGLGALQKLAKGQKMSTKEILSSIGDQIFAKGQGHILEGIAMAFIPGMQASAGGLIAAGGAELAFGMVLGAAGSGGGGGGTGGSAPHARRGESGSDYLDRTRAASPTTSSGGRSGGTTIISQTFNTPTMIAVTDEDARRLQRAAREGALHGVNAG